MYELNTLVMVALIALAVGAFAGAWLFSRFAPENQSRKAMEDHIQKLQEQHKDYQQQVNQHFNKTADLLNQMAGSYRDVHNHLVQSAQTLTSTGISPLQPLPEGRPVLEGDSSPSVLQQPLDYAPHTPGRKGALSEDFGLEKLQRREKAEEAPEEEEDPSISSLR